MRHFKNITEKFKGTINLAKYEAGLLAYNTALLAAVGLLVLKKDDKSKGHQRKPGSGQPTKDILDFIDDFEEAAQDHATFGPLWAEMVFPDDFDALRAIYGGKSSDDNNGGK